MIERHIDKKIDLGRKRVKHISSWQRQFLMQTKKYFQKLLNEGNLRREIALEVEQLRNDKKNNSVFVTSANFPRQDLVLDVCCCVTSENNFLVFKFVSDSFFSGSWTRTRSLSNFRVC